MKGQTKYYCFTLARPKMVWEEISAEFPEEWEWDEDPTRWKAFPDIQYMVYQLERAPSGLPHLQGYLELKNRARFVTLKKRMPALEGAHWEARQGTCEEARNYCMKVDTRIAGPWEHGVFEPEAQRKDSKTKATEKLVKRVREGASDLELWEEHPGLMLIHNRNVGEARRAFAAVPKRAEMPSVFLFAGTAGSGKSRTAHTIASFLGSVYVVPTAKSSGLYFDGYRGERSVIIDDMDGARCTPGFFKQLCDRYPFTVPVHGRGNVEFNSPYIFITTNRAPRFWWAKQSTTEQKAIMRRFCCIRFFGTVRPQANVVAYDASSGVFASVSAIMRHP